MMNALNLFANTIAKNRSFSGATSSPHTAPRIDTDKFSWRSDAVGFEGLFNARYQR